MGPASVLVSLFFVAVGALGHEPPVGKQPSDPASTGIHDDSVRYPVAEATHRTSQIEASVSCSGGMGLYNGSSPYFVFPAGSKMSYLFSADIWVGGIVEQDTAVSTSLWYQFYCREGSPILTSGQELFPPSSQRDYVRHLRPIASCAAGTAFRTEAVDTFAAEHGLRNFDTGTTVTPHRPMGIRSRPSMVECWMESTTSFIPS